MHVDDAKFHQKDTEINGRKVNYIVLEKLDAEKLNENSKHLAGQWQLSFGEKGNTDSRFFGLLNKEELASIRHRAEVTLDEHDQVKSVGKPLTMARRQTPDDGRYCCKGREPCGSSASCQ